MQKLLYKEEVYTVVGAAYEVHNTLGCGFLEAVYQEAMEIELDLKGIPFSSQAEIPVIYKGHKLKKHYVADFLVYGCIVMEIKAMDKLTGIETAQLLNYLKATGLRCGVLINFGGTSLEWKRMVL